MINTLVVIIIIIVQLYKRNIEMSNKKLTNEIVDQRLLDDNKPIKRMGN